MILFAINTDQFIEALKFGKLESATIIFRSIFLCAFVIIKTETLGLPWSLLCQHWLH